jgi:hypothetical protein
LPGLGDPSAFACWVHGITDMIYHTRLISTLKVCYDDVVLGHIAIKWKRSALCWEQFENRTEYIK